MRRVKAHEVTGYRLQVTRSQAPRQEIRGERLEGKGDEGKRKMEGERKQNDTTCRGESTIYILSKYSKSSNY